jgi:hypothetical protein
MDRRRGKGKNGLVNDGQIRFETTVGTLEVWIGQGGEVRVFAFGDDDRAQRMLGNVVGSQSELAALLLELGLVDREADWYAKEIWKIASPTPEPGLAKRRKQWGQVDLPTPPYFGGPTG